jgi:hypothetical protein
MLDGPRIGVLYEIGKTAIIIDDGEELDGPLRKVCCYRADKNDL